MPIDFSDISWKALKYAASLARLFGCRFCLMHVFNRGLFGERDQALLAKSVDEAVDEATREPAIFSPRALAPELRGPTTARIGRASREITQVAEISEIDLIFIAGHEGRSLNLLVGGTVEKVVRYSPCPVLTIRGSVLSGGETDPADWRQILVPVDFSECSRLALRYAVALASHLNAKVHLLNVLKTEYPGSDPLNVFLALSRRRGQVERQIGAWFEEGIPAALRGEELECWGASTPDVIDHTAECHKSDLIVIGTHGYTGFERLWKGSITEQVIRYAPCAVLTIPQRWRER